MLVKQFVLEIRQSDSRYKMDTAVTERLETRD